MRSLLVLVALMIGLAGPALVAAPAAAVTIRWVRVGDPGNTPDTASYCYSANCGSVAYDYYISKYEVTNAQYAEFLNAKADSDPLGLYDERMGSSFDGGITRSGGAGSYTYAAKPDFADKPVNFVSFYDSLRLANWLNNGQGSADTETGAYTLLGGTAIPSNGTTVARNADSDIFLPSENEWYKAAYYSGILEDYFFYPARSNTPIACADPGPTPNTANCSHLGGGHPTDVGAYTGSFSPYATFDQGGNVYEWNEEIVSGTRRGIRGGAFNQFPGTLAASASGFANPSIGDAVFGIRLAAVSIVPEPGTALLVMAGVLGLAAGRRSAN